VAPHPTTEMPAEDDPMQVSVKVVVRAGAAIGGAERMVWSAGT
jgi:hypothetical protein